MSSTLQSISIDCRIKGRLDIYFATNQFSAIMDLMKYSAPNVQKCALAYRSYLYWLCFDADYIYDFNP